MVSAALFDVDGTLVSFEFDVQGTRKALLEEMQSRGFEVGGLGLRFPTQTILDAAKGQAGEGRKYNAFRRRAYSILDKFEIESAATTSVFPGTRDELQYLKSRGIRLAILTNSGRKASSEALKKAGIGDCFEFVLTRDDTETMKPRPEGIMKAVEMLRIPSTSVYYVGDSVYDIIAAKGAGVKVVSVATGNYTIEKLRDEGSDFVVSSITELRAILGV